jgi:glycosyltransferase involved in cell wall biosynthesis
MKRPLRIAIDARVLGQRGVGRYLANLLQALSQRRDPARYLLLLGRLSRLERVPDDPRFETLDLGGLHPAWAEQVAVPRAARAWGADLLHYPDNSGALRPGLPMLLTLHDTMWRRPLGQAIAQPTLRQRLQDAYRKAVCPRAARAAARILTISRHSLGCLRNELGLAVAKLSLVTEGVDPVFGTRATPGDVRARLRRLDVVGPYVLCSGAADRRKNIDRLIQAFALARGRDARLRGAKLLVTSLRPGEAAATTYRQSAKDAGLGGAMQLLPYVSDLDMRALYQGALCFAFPSLWEGFGLPVLEAYSLGCPVLASQAAALPETAGQGAVLADPLSVNDLARGLVEACGPKGRAALRRGAAAALRRHRWDLSAAQHWRAYRQAAGSP